MRAIVSLISCRVMLIGGWAVPFCRCGGVRMVFNGVAGGQSIMCLSLQRRCRWFGFFRVGCACDVAGFLGVTGGGGMFVRTSLLLFRISDVATRDVACLFALFRNISFFFLCFPQSYFEFLIFSLILILGDPAVEKNRILVLARLQIYFLLVLLLAESFLPASCFRFFRSTLLVYRFLLGLCFLDYYMFFCSCLSGLAEG